MTPRAISATPEEQLRALATGDEQAAEALRQALASEDAVVRESTARLLIRTLSAGAPELIGPVASLLQEVVEPFTASVASGAFDAALAAADRTRDSAALDSLLLVIVHACADVPELEPRLVELLKSRSAGIRAVAIGAFGRVARAHDAPKLLPLLADADPLAARAALDSALSLASEASELLVPAIVEVLPGLRGEARYSALAGLRGVLLEVPNLSKEIAPALGPVALGSLEDPDPAVQLEACALLGLLPSTPASVQALTARLEHPAEVACSAAAALVELGGELAAPLKVLLRCCESKQKEERDAGFAALGELTAPGLHRAAALLVTLRRHPDLEVRESAHAIGRSELSS